MAALRSFASPPKCSAPAAIAESDISTRPSHVADLLQPVDQRRHRGRAQLHRLAQPPGGQRLPPAGGVHDRHQGADVGAAQPVLLGEPLPDCIQFDGQPAKEQCQLPPRALVVLGHLHPPFASGRRPT
jgi:hypothetical protein